MKNLERFAQGHASCKWHIGHQTLISVTKSSIKCPILYFILSEEHCDSGVMRWGGEDNHRLGGKEIMRMTDVGGAGQGTMAPPFCQFGYRFIVLKNKGRLIFEPLPICLILDTFE